MRLVSWLSVYVKFLQRIALLPQLYIQVDQLQPDATGQAGLWWAGLLANMVVPATCMVQSGRTNHPAEWRLTAVNPLGTISNLYTAARELGTPVVLAYAVYRLGLVTGHYARLAARRRAQAHPATRLEPLWQIPEKSVLAGMLDVSARQALLVEAERIYRGRAVLYGGIEAEIDLVPAGAQLLWTEYAAGRVRAVRSDGEAVVDIKDLWEPARFGWVYPLGRAYLLTEEERYAETFWRFFESFQFHHPPEIGPHWLSAQEVALRLLAFTFARQVFAPAAASTPERLTALVQAVAAHAARIPDTLVYARAQANNHLLSEATGLYTAAAALPEHPQASAWQALGWKWFHRGLEMQIAEDGAYSQHSANYTRLMLQLALWMVGLSARQGKAWPADSQAKLAAATRWLLAHSDPESGRAPNLGPNDGAYILPLASGSFEDYRPVLQAAGMAFLNVRPFASGLWDEMAAWLLPDQPNSTFGLALPALDDWPPAPDVVRAPDFSSWAYLRAAQFNGRPGHADQLHCDLWWQGRNLALDAGTYRYSAEPPWDNALAGTAVHNTVSVAGRDQMRRVGRFLWLSRAPARLEPGEHDHQLLASHLGYQSLGLRHRRVVTYQLAGRWLVEDTLECVGNGKRAPGLEAEVSARLHWLLPDWPWEAWETGEGLEIYLAAPQGGLAVLKLAADRKIMARQLIRAGELVFGTGEVNSVAGWYAPGYGAKQPALAVVLVATVQAPLRFSSEWRLLEPRQDEAGE